MTFGQMIGVVEAGQVKAVTREQQAALCSLIDPIDIQQQAEHAITKPIVRIEEALMHHIAVVNADGFAGGHYAASRTS